MLFLPTASLWMKMEKVSLQCNTSNFALGFGIVQTMTFNRLSDTSAKNSQLTTPQKRANASTESPKRRYNPFNDSNTDSPIGKGKKKATGKNKDNIPNSVVDSSPSNNGPKDYEEGQSEKKMAEDNRSVTASPPSAPTLVLPYYLLI